MNTGPSINKELCAQLSILIVDDSAEMRRLLTALLTAMGFRLVLEARDGQAALDLVSNHAPDIIVTDAAMQPMNGHEMTKRIRAGDAGEDNRDTPILMLSGHVNRENLDHARAHGVTEYIAKPVTAELLYRCVLSALSRPVHIVETGAYRGPSPRRRMDMHDAFNMPDI